MTSSNRLSIASQNRRDFLQDSLAGALGVGLVAGLVDAQGPTAAAQEKPELPPPENVTLETTKDGFVLRATYYPGTNKEDSVPIIMVHDYGQHSRAEFHRLALGLQKNRGHAVLVPDLRGHGDSTRRRMPDGSDKEVAYDQLKPNDFAAMIAMDLEECKRFLMRKHHAKELNIEKLVVVGAGPMGSVVALNWVHQDWSWKQTPFLKQGQDVKALVLLSPANNFKTLKTAQVFSHPYIAAKLSVMLVGGKTESDVKQLHNKFKAKHAPMPEDEAERVRNQDLFLVLEETDLRGAALLGPELKVSPTIMQFIDLRIVNKSEDFPWKSRERKTD